MSSSHATLPQVVAQSVRRSVYRGALATLPSALATLAGLHRQPAPLQPITVLTFSIYPDLSRIWHHYVRKYCSPDRFRLLLVDCAGTLDPILYPGVQTIRFLNVYHGRKIDVMLRRVIRSRYVLLLDDDKFIVDHGINDLLPKFESSRAAAISLSPRTRWDYAINGRRQPGMGSYAVAIDREVILKEQLSFRPSRLQSQHRLFPAGHKIDNAYDTGDYANEQLLKRNYPVMIAGPEYREKVLTGFDSSSYCAILFESAAKADIRQMLIEVPTYTNTFVGIMRCAYTNAKLTQLYRRLFSIEPQRPAPFQESEMFEILDTVRDAARQTELAEYYRRADQIAEQLLAAA